MATIMNKSTNPVLFLDIGRCATIAWQSEMNPWMGFLLVVPLDRAQAASDTAAEALDEYWNEEWETYGDAVECSLKWKDIPYIILYHDDEDESDEYEQRWNEVGLKLQAATADWYYLD